MFINAIYEKFNKNKKYIFYSLIIFIIFIGIFIRTKLYLTEIPFWGDEASLCAALADRNIFDTFTELSFGQKAPPLFCSLCLLATKIFGFNILSLRFVPFCSSILILFFAYKLLKKNLRNPLAIITGMLFFSLNPMLLYYSAEFKPYSSDILIFIILLLIYSKYNEKTSLPEFCNKHVILSAALLSILSVITVLFSFPSIFIIPSIITVQYIQERNHILKYIGILICIILTGLYLWKSDINTYTSMYNFWKCFENQNYFLSFSDGNFLKIVSKYLIYIFGPLKLFLKILIILFMFLGTVLYIKEKNKNIFIILLTLIFLYTASLLKLYPLVQRLELFLFPAFILILIKPMDIIYTPIFNNKKYTKIIILLLSYTVLSILYFYTHLLIFKETYFNLYNYFLSIELRNGYKELVEYIISHSNKNIIIIDEQNMTKFIKSYHKISGTNLNAEVIKGISQYKQIPHATIKNSDIWVTINKNQKENIKRNKIDIETEKEFPGDIYLYKIYSNKS